MVAVSYYDKISKMIICIGFTFSIVLDQAGFVYSLIPYFINFFLLAVSDLLAKKHLEAETIFRIMRFTTRTCILVLGINISRKLDERTDTEWSELVWPFWILFVLFLVVSFISTALFISRFFPKLLLKEGSWNESNSFINSFELDVVFF